MYVWPCFPLLWQCLGFILSKLERKRKGSEKKGVHWWKNVLLFPLSCKNLAAAVAAAAAGAVFHSGEHTGNL